MKLMGGIGIFVMVILIGLHFLMPKKTKTRLMICIALSILFCSTGTLHGVFTGIALFLLELILNKLINK